MPITGLVGISTAETGRFSAFYASLFGLQHKGDISVVFSRGADIAYNRNTITQEALRQQVDWVLYLDDDHLLRPDTLSRLLAAEKDVISAHYIQRQPPFNPVAMGSKIPGGFLPRQLGSDERGVISTLVVGAGCLLVRRPVLEALTPPYWRLGQISPASWGDDMDFCNRVREAGFEVCMDLDTPIGHLMTGVVWPGYDEKDGWVAHFAQDPLKGPIAHWPMPLPGDSP